MRHVLLSGAVGSGTSADIMKVGGYKLSALEIESTLLEVNINIHLSFLWSLKVSEAFFGCVLCQHPTVAECCVVGLPDKDYGEAVTAIIVAESGAKRKREEESKPVMTLEELCGWAKDKLAPYKVVSLQKLTKLDKIFTILPILFYFLFLATNTFADMGELATQRHGKGN